MNGEIVKNNKRQSDDPVADTLTRVVIVTFIIAVIVYVGAYFLIK